MLRGAAPALRPGSREEEVYAEGMQGSEALVGEEVGPDDVVVLHDPLTAVLAQAIRERGAHAVLHVSIGAAPLEAGAGEAWSFMREYVSPIDAYVTDWREPVRRGPVVQRVGALIPSARVVAAKEIEAWAGEPYQELAWGTLLADVVHTDRDETVGGTLRPRPAVAAR
jgi:trehalose synthase